MISSSLKHNHNTAWANTSLIPEDTDTVSNAAEPLVLEQPLGVVLNAKVAEYEESRYRGTAASPELGHEHARFRSEADAIMQQLVALKQYINNYIQ